MDKVLKLVGVTGHINL